MVNAIVEGFSLSHAAILDGTSGAEAVNGSIYGIRSGSISLGISNYDNTGDDAILSTWYWGDKATVTVQSGYVPFDTIALLSTSKVTSTSQGTAAAQFSLPLWELANMNVPPRPMLIRVPSRDSQGNIRRLDFVLYKVQFEPFSFDGPQYKSGLLLNYTGSALFSDTDEKGQPVIDSETGNPSKAIGRLISAPSL